jgi:hypothetical protein
MAGRAAMLGLALAAYQEVRRSNTKLFNAAADNKLVYPVFPSFLPMICMG